MHPGKSSPPYLFILLVGLIAGAVSLVFVRYTFFSEPSFDEGGRLQVVDVEGRPVPGLRVALDAEASTATDKEGTAAFSGEGFPRRIEQQEVSVHDKQGNEWFVVAPWAGQGALVAEPEASPEAVTAVRVGDAELLDSEAFLAWLVRHLTANGGGAWPRLDLPRTAERLGLAPADVERALLRHGETADTPLERAVVALAVRRPAEAVRILLEEPPAEGADLAERAWYLGQAESTRGRWLEAANAYQTSLERGGSYARLRHPLAESLVLSGHQAAALPHAEEELTHLQAELGENHRDTLRWELLVAHVLNEVGEPERAESHLQRLRELAEKPEYADPTFKVGVLKQLGLALEKQGKTAEAAKVRDEVSRYVAELERSGSI